MMEAAQAKIELAQHVSSTEDMLARPADERARGALELQLEKLLEENGELAGQIREIWERYPATSVIVASGLRDSIGLSRRPGLDTAGLPLGLDGTPGRLLAWCVRPLRSRAMSDPI